MRTPFLVVPALALAAVASACGEVSNCATFPGPGGNTPVTAVILDVDIVSPTCPVDIPGPYVDTIFQAMIYGDPYWVRLNDGTVEASYTTIYATDSFGHLRSEWRHYRFNSTDYVGNPTQTPTVPYRAGTEGGPSGKDIGFFEVHRCQQFCRFSGDWASAHAELRWNRRARPAINGPTAATAYSWNYYFSSVTNVQNPRYYKWYINGYDAYWSGPTFWFSAGPGWWQLRVDVWDDDGEVGSDYKYVNIPDNGGGGGGGGDGGCAPAAAATKRTAGQQSYWLSESPPETMPDDSLVGSSGSRSRSRGLGMEFRSNDTVSVVGIC